MLGLYAALGLWIASGSVVAQNGEPISIGIVTDDLQPGCQAVENLSGGSYAYGAHLATRFGQPIELCAYRNDDELAAALSDAQLTMAWITENSPKPATNRYRTFLTSRTEDGLGRIEIIYFTKLESNITEPDDLHDRSLAIRSASPQALHRGQVLAVAQDLRIDLPRLDIKPFEGFSAVGTAVRNGRAAAGALEASSWFALCMEGGKPDQACDDLRVLARSRPSAKNGMLIKSDASDELRFRMTGVHAQLHLEAPAALEWLTGGRLELEPTEPHAFGMSRN